MDVDEKVTALEKKLAAASEADKPDIQKELDAETLAKYEALWGDTVLN